uniref:pancreatic elastase II n=1 Tax=Seriola lalandi dorsalis TaxID=1841481 RepID=A0A3B4YPJ7_SERLL
MSGLTAGPGRSRSSQAAAGAGCTSVEAPSSPLTGSSLLPTVSSVCQENRRVARRNVQTSHDRNRYRVELGKHSLKASEEGAIAVGTAKIITHEDYNIMLSRNDIALIKLSSPVTLSDTVMPACLPDRDSVLPHGSPCYVTGWGRLSTSGPLADILQQALLPVVGHNICKQPDWWSVLATDKMVCAGGDGITAGCNGDSGGPLNCQNPDGSWDVHGVVSFGSGQGCNVFQKPTVFTQVSSYISWINTIMTKY